MTIHADEINVTENVTTELDAASADVPATDGANARQEAVWAALVTNEGATATEIAMAANVGRPAASKILNALEADGRAVRTPGGHSGPGKGRTPDRWHPVTDISENIDEPAENTDEQPDLADDIEGAPEPDADATSELSVVDDSAEGADEEEPAHLDEDEETPEPEAMPDSPDEPSSEQESDSETGSDETPDDGTPDDETPDDETPGEDAEDVEEAEELAAVEDPAWTQARRELLELADLIIGTVTAKDGNDDAITALGRLEMAMAKASQVHRNARAVLTGTTTAPARAVARPASGGGTGGGVRPGALRDRVLGHLTEHPDKEFTPYEIGRVLDASSGAVANALDRLVALGQAQLTCERPRRFGLAATATAA
ncbi:helix-turn-helix domain-containing protein [Herbidospora cretacea]|uniref:helix-turn-helix domain-containing protein n=1 Tax=Herbidospora cretacea TaxID=28444 RepID=UPI000774B9D1|nr:helix-turn-helix domain-containing protein [Herbidospora cretacea]